MTTKERLRILVLEGDGIGPEITAATLQVLRAADARFALGLTFENAAIGYPVGTGLGLYIARSAAEKMGGSLVLEASEPGVGSTFRLDLARASLS